MPATPSAATVTGGTASFADAASPDPRRPAPLRRRAQPVPADHAAARDRALGFVQADPIRAPARAQDLTLRHRVKDYRAGDLERRYPALASRKTSSSTTASCRAAVQALMHPRDGRRALDAGDAGGSADDAAGVRARARRRASARGGCAVRARHASPTTGAAPRARRRICWTPCTTAACCAWRGASAASASTRRTSTRAGPADAAGAPRARVDALRRRRRAQVCAAARREPVVPGAAGCATPCRSGEAS